MEGLGGQHDEDFDLEKLHARLEAAEFTSDREFTAYGKAPEEIAKLRRWIQDWATDLGLRLAAQYDSDNE